MIRSVVISFFVLAFSFGMAITNQVNTQWASEHGGRPLISAEKSPYLTYEATGIPFDRSGYNETMRNITTVDAPLGLDNSIGLLQNVKYAGVITNTLFYCVFGFPQFLTLFGMPQVFVIPLVIFMNINHMLALMYIVTGRTFIY